MFKLSFNKDSKQMYGIVLICLTLWGCGSTPTTKKSFKDNIITVGETTQSYEYYINLSRSTSGVNQQAYQLLALRAALQNNRVGIVEQLFEKLAKNTMLTDSHTLELQLLHSLRFASDDNLKEAIKALIPNQQWIVSSKQLAAYYQQQAHFLLQDDKPTLAIESLVKGELAAEDTNQVSEIQSLIWNTYQLLTLEQLNGINSEPYSLEHSGWHELALLFKNSLHSPEGLAAKLEQWKVKFSTHLAVNNLPQQIIEAKNVKPFKPNKIAVILPLTGRYARLGQAVQNGFTSNLLKINNEQEVITFDSNELGGIGAYEQALALNSEFIIGPLLKENVEKVSSIQSLIPTLFLNTPLEINRLSNQFYFSLDKENEAVQGANYIFKLGKKRPVIVAPDNVKGHQMAQLFQEQWLELHTNESDVNNTEPVFFTNNKLLKKTIEQLFETNQSQARINLTRLLVDNKMKSSTRSRRDIDAIYLIANPEQTAMLMPSIEVTVSADSEKVPVFVGSSGNNYRFNDKGITHLNQLNVSEIPWFLTPSEVSPQTINALWPKINQSQLRLFAMGHDSLELISQLAQMALFPEYSLKGLTGDLSLNDNGQIQRQLSWAKFTQGRLKKTQ